MPKRPAKPSSDKPSKSGGNADGKPHPDAPQEAPAGTQPGEGVVHDPEAAAAAIAAIESQQKKIVIAAVAIALVVVAVVIFRQVQEARHLAASQAYTEAVASGSADKLNTVVSEYAGTTSGGNALLSRAELELTSGKTGDAKASLTRFTKEYADHPRLVQGYYALGNIEQNGGNLDAAKAQYDLALKAGPDSELAPLIKIRQADIAAAQGDKEAARQLYDAIPQSHPANPFIDMIDQRLAALDAPAIPRVKAPPAPAPAPKPEPKPAPQAEAKPKPAAKPAPPTPVAPPKPAADKPATDSPAPAAKPTPPTPAPKPAQDAAKPAPAAAKPEAAPTPTKPEAKPEATPEAKPDAKPEPAKTPAAEPAPASTPEPAPKPAPAPEAAAPGDSQ